MRRRDFLKISVAGAAGTSLLAAPRYVRAADLFSKDVKAKGILGRPV